MSTITVPEDMARYPEIVSRVVVEMRLQAGMSHISLNYRDISGQHVPLLLIDFYNERGRLYPLCYRLPPGTPEETERRVSLLLRLTRAALDETSRRPVA